MPRYQEIANALRARIQNGEWAVGDQLPSISALQEQYKVPSLNTIRAAQQQLVEEGMLVTERGRGAFVVTTSSLKEVDVVAELSGARDRLTTVLKVLEAPARAVTFDLDEEHTPFVLDDALREWSAQQEWKAEEDARTDPDDPTAAQRRAWAATADRLLGKLEAAVAGKTSRRENL